jgi:hypothetical protein
MSDLRELTNAELDIVGGGLMSTHACHNVGMTTATSAATRSQPTGGRENLMLELIVDILKILPSFEKGALGAQRAPVTAQRF